MLSSAMLDSICEPVILEGGQLILVDLARVADTQSGEDVFFHFHDVAELILFGGPGIECDAHVEDQQFPLLDRSVMFLPSMLRHGFDYRRGRRNRLLIQFDPSLITSLGDTGTISALQQVICVQPRAQVMRQLETLGLWLLDGVQRDPMAPANRDLLRLMLRTLVQTSASDTLIAPMQTDTRLSSHHRMDVLLKRLSADPGENLSLQQAADLCCLSPAYFSRSFKKAFGMTWSAYRRSQKLKIAARRLCRNSRQVAQIGYDLGFASPSHFVAAFKEQFGMTPEQFRKHYTGWHQFDASSHDGIDMTLLDFNAPMDWSALTPP